MITIGNALRAATERLVSIDTAESDAAELLSRLLGVGRGDLARTGDRALSGEQAQTLETWIARRLTGEPVQYITGRAAFRSIDLAVTRDVLVPRPETEWLVEAVLEVIEAERAHWDPPRVLDLGTGSGAIALAIATECPRAVVTATDFSDAALEVAKTNAAAVAPDAMPRFLQGDWFDAVGSDDRFEVIVSNPPYIATGEWDALPQDVRAFEPHQALFSGASGLDAAREIIDEAPRHLVAGGLLAMELDESRVNEVAGWLDGAHDWSEVSVRDDLAERPRVLLARREAGPAIAPQQWKEEQ